MSSIDTEEQSTTDSEIDNEKKFKKRHSREKKSSSFRRSIPFLFRTIRWIILVMCDVCLTASFDVALFEGIKKADQTRSDILPFKYCFLVTSLIVFVVGCIGADQKNIWLLYGFLFLLTVHIYLFVMINNQSVVSLLGQMLIFGLDSLMFILIILFIYLYMKGGDKMTNKKKNDQDEDDEQQPKMKKTNDKDTAIDMTQLEEEGLEEQENSNKSNTDISDKPKKKSKKKDASPKSLLKRKKDQKKKSKR